MSIRSTCDASSSTMPKHDRHWVFLTNNFDLPALTIAQLYRCRWQVELFFKRSNDYDSDEPQYVGQNGQGENGNQWEGDRHLGQLGRSNLEQHHNWITGFPGSNRCAIPGAGLPCTTVSISMYVAIRWHGKH